MTPPGNIKVLFEKIKGNNEGNKICTYESNHCMILDGWVYEELMGEQLKWIEEKLK